MLARLTSGIALASMAALVLVGCTPDEPTDAEVLAEARESFEGFNHAIDAEAADGSITAAELGEYATPELATQWAQDIQASLDDGTTSRGVLMIVDFELADRSPELVSTEVCTDGREIETTLADGSTLTPSGLVAWSATFSRTTTDGDLLLASLDPITDQRICG